MILVYTLIVIAFFISLATIDSPESDSQRVNIEVEDKQIGLMYAM